MVWKVKKEIPMGSGMPNWGKLTPGSKERLDAKKSQYLKKPSSARLNTTDCPTNHRASRSRCRNRSTSIPWV